MRDFIGWCDQQKLRTPDQITRQVLERYLLSLQAYRTRKGEPLAWHSKEAKLVPVRSFFRWLSEVEERVPKNPAAQLKQARRPPGRNIVVPSTEVIDKILDQPNVCLPIGIRDRAMLETLFGTGIRRMELANLHIADVDAAARLLHIQNGKGGKARTVPIAERALSWIKKYIDEVRVPSSPDEPILFLTERGEPFNLSWLTTAIGAHIHAATGKRTGSCHLLRHSMATHMLRGGADSRYVQALLGHASIATTQLYTHVDTEDLQKVYERVHPSARQHVPAPGAPPPRAASIRPVASGPESTQLQLMQRPNFSHPLPLKDKVAAIVERLSPAAAWADVMHLAASFQLVEEMQRKLAMTPRSSARMPIRLSAEDFEWSRLAAWSLVHHPVITVG